MNKMMRGIKKIGYLFATIISKIIWGNKLSVDGVFRKRNDTQIIISDHGRMVLGKLVTFQRNVSLSAVGGRLIIGNGVSFNRNCIIICRKDITIGENVILGPGVTIYDHDHIFTDAGISQEYKHGSVIIEKGSWIGANVTILRNTHIGEGSVIGAGCVVQGNIPPHSLVRSNRELQVVEIERRIQSQDLV